MKLLLDENLPKKLKYRFSSNFFVQTASDLGWQ
jgi:predicted nuclease of predicted toxin-antitoxin system